MASTASACKHVPMRPVRLAAESLRLRLTRLDVEHWTKIIALVPPAAPAPASRESTSARAQPRCSTAAELSALAATAARLRKPVLGVLGERAALPIATLASLGGGGVCVALESSSLAVTAPAYGLPLSFGESAMLSRLRQPGLGAYLALTGGILGTHELVHTGIARDYVHSRTFARLKDALAAVDDLDALGGLDIPPATATVTVGANSPPAPAPPAAELRRALRARAAALALHVAMYGQVHEVSAPAGLAERLAQIGQAFHLGTAAGGGGSGSLVGDVAKQLASGRPSEWSVRALRAMAAGSPLGLELAARQLRAAAAAPSLGECLRAEARARAAFETHVPDHATRTKACERAATLGFGLEPWHETFGAFAGLDAPGSAPEPEGSPEALAARICDATREAAAVLDGWRLEAR